MIKFEFRDKTIEAPSQWEEVTVAHFINPHFLARDSIGLLSALSGIDRGVLLNATEDITEVLNKIVSFVALNPNGYTGDVPQEFELMGKKCKVPVDIELERVGQKIMLQDAMGRYKFVYQAIPEAIAIYLIPELTKSKEHPNGIFDDAMIPEVVEHVGALRIMDVFPIADFFLDKYRGLVKNGKLFLNPYQALTNNSQDTGKPLPEIE